MAFGIFQVLSWHFSCGSVWKKRAVLNLILLDAFRLHEPFYDPGQCFRVFLNSLDLPILDKKGLKVGI